MSRSHGCPSPRGPDRSGEDAARCEYETPESRTREQAPRLFWTTSRWRLAGSCSAATPIETAARDPGSGSVGVRGRHQTVLSLLACTARLAQACSSWFLRGLESAAGQDRSRTFSEGKVPHVATPRHNRGQTSVVSVSTSGRRYQRAGSKPIHQGSTVAFVCAGSGRVACRRRTPCPVYIDRDQPDSSPFAVLHGGSRRRVAPL